MLLKKWIVPFAACMLFAPVFGDAADAPIKGPSVFLPKSVHEFEPVVEGTAVTHDFIIQNRGDEPLKIIKIESG